jgi:hypothetical protein
MLQWRDSSGRSTRAEHPTASPAHLDHPRRRCSRTTSFELREAQILSPSIAYYTMTGIYSIAASRTQSLKHTQVTTPQVYSARARHTVRPGMCLRFTTFYDVSAASPHCVSSLGTEEILRKSSEETNSLHFPIEYSALRIPCKPNHR